jgi:hypothetical protein
MIEDMFKENERMGPDLILVIHGNVQQKGKFITN